MQYLSAISRLFVGIVFIFSGFVKAIDPLGSAYKFGDYFTAFGFDFFQPTALPLAIFLSSAELTIGITLLISYRMKFFSWVALFFMSFFTILTFILAIYNPVTDCGCFGDAIILTNWETFWKNMVIMVFVIIIFLQRFQFIGIREKLTEWLVIGFIFISVSGLSVYALNNLPPLDFRPYSIGSNVPDKMTIPPDAPRDEYQTTLIYRNKLTGRNEEFSLNNFPGDTSQYSFVDAQSKLVSKGYEPEIHDFSISSLSGTDITDIILNDKGYSFLLISYDLFQADRKGLEKAESLSRFSKIAEGIDIYGVTSSTAQTINDLREEMKFSFEFYQADEITLKTIIRANPGLVLLKNGNIIGKWHFNNFPESGYKSFNFHEVISNYPFSPGTDLRGLNAPPPGAGSDTYETILYYKNILTDSISAFSIENFPQSPEWVFENSRSKLVQRGFSPPLIDFKPLTPEGKDISNEILNSRHNIFLTLVSDPQNIDPEILSRVNNLSILASGSDTAEFSFYMITTLDVESLINFSNSFVSLIQISTLSGEYVERIAGDGIALVWIRDGKVMAIRKDKEIPEPSQFNDFISYPHSPIDADNIILPVLAETYRIRWEKRFVYISILSLISFGLLIKVWFDGRKKISQ